jgi:hypothetical protein
MKKSITKLTINRETLRALNNVESPGDLVFPQSPCPLVTRLISGCIPEVHEGPLLQNLR